MHKARARTLVPLFQLKTSVKQVVKNAVIFKGWKILLNHLTFSQYLVTETSLRT